LVMHRNSRYEHHHVANELRLGPFHFWQSAQAAMLPCVGDIAKPTQLRTGREDLAAETNPRRAATILPRISVVPDPIAQVPDGSRCQSAFKFDPVLERRVLAVALAPSELVGVAETGRARVA
jgi:hypothetical protein